MVGSPYVGMRVKNLGSLKEWDEGIILLMRHNQMYILWSSAAICSLNLNYHLVEKIL